MWKVFQVCPQIAASAHAFAARVVASAAHSGNLREIARLNLFIHFIAHFHVMLGKPMKLYGVNHCTLRSFCVNFHKNCRFTHFL